MRETAAACIIECLHIIKDEEYSYEKKKQYLSDVFAEIQNAEKKHYDNAFYL